MFRRIVPAALALLLMGVALPAAAQTAGLSEVVVYTARVADGVNLPDEALVDIARADGAVEVLRFWQGAPLERLVLTVGTPGIGFPGFTSMNREAAEGALAKGTHAVSDKGNALVLEYAEGRITVDWTLPKSVGASDFRADVRIDGEWVYTETRTEVAGAKNAAQPELIRVDHENGETIVQYFAYGEPVPAEWDDPYAEFSGLDTSGTFEPQPFTDPAKTITKGGVRFESLHGFVFDYDSGFWPGGGTRPGAFPLQVRLEFGAAWARGGELNGNFFLEEGGQLTLSNAEGRWWIDYGVELDTVGAVSVPILGSFEFELPYIPNFDYRLEREAIIRSWLFAQGATITIESDPYELFDLDVVDLIAQAINGTGTPDWLPLAAGAKLDGTLGVDATLWADSVALSDGTTFISPWQTNTVALDGRSYSATVEYNAHIDTELVARLYPELYLEVLWQRFDLPLGTLRWAPVGIELPLDFSKEQLTLTLPDVPEAPIVIEPDPEPETPIEIIEPTPEFPEPEPAPEGAVEEGEAPAVEEGEATPVPAGPIECGEFSNKSGPVIIEDRATIDLTTEVTGTGDIEDLAVWLDVYHPNPRELRISLISPTGREVVLFFLSGFTSQNVSGITLWDGASRAVTSESGAFSGVYQPFTPFAPLIGEEAAGTWTLRVFDSEVRNKGVLANWKLLVNPCDIKDTPDTGEGEAPTTEGAPDPAMHSLDYQPADGVISLSELLRAVQFFNLGGYHCAEATEDGYRPGAGPDGCTPHSADYGPQDWALDLSELLRQVQFFNTGGYYAEPRAEDGFAPGLAPR